MPDYKKAVIYKITTGDSLYIGSTCNFTKRKCDHKTNIYNQNCKSYNLKLYKTIRDNGWNWDMKPYKEYPCENKTQLVIEEERLRKELNADLNMYSCATGLSMKEYHKQNYIKIKDKISEKRKEYRIINRDKNIEYHKHYQIKNKDKITERKRRKTICECGCIVSKCCLPKHKRTNKHIELMEKK